MMLVLIEAHRAIEHSPNSKLDLALPYLDAWEPE